MATVVSLHVPAESFNCIKVNDKKKLLRRGLYWSSTRRILGGRKRFSLRVLKAEDEEQLGKKKLESEEDQSIVKLNRENGFWISMKSIILSRKSDDEYRQAVAKVEEVLSSVSCFN